MTRATVPNFNLLLTEWDDVDDRFTQAEVAAQTALRRLGIPDMTAPTLASPILTQSLSSMPNDALMDVQGAAGAWMAYVGGVLADAKMQQSGLMYRMKVLRSSIKERLTCAANQKEDKVNIDPRVIELSAQLLECELVVTKLQAHWDGLEALRKPASRYVGLREAELTDSLREHNVGNRRRPVRI